nr:MAG TPA: hypothetical protein [Microviridae sp.]
MLKFNNVKMLKTMWKKLKNPKKIDFFPKI